MRSTRLSGLRGPARVDAAAQVFVADLDDELIALSGEDAHHLSRVLRLKDGEAVVACDGAGAWRLCRYLGSAGRLEPDGPVIEEPAPSAPIAVGFVPVKGDRTDWAVQKLTELGVDTIVLLSSARAVVRWEGERLERALEKLRRVAREASSQSRRARPPQLAGILSLAELGELVGPRAVALAHPGGGPLPPGTSALAVGPEGGWDEAELDAAPALVGLSDAVLRSETAAVSAGTLLASLRSRVVRYLI